MSNKDTQKLIDILEEALGRKVIDPFREMNRVSIRIGNALDYQCRETLPCAAVVLENYLDAIKSGKHFCKEAYEYLKEMSNVEIILTRKHEEG